jgi:3-oxoacyl-[acyl-carrier protein] reductase
MKFHEINIGDIAELKHTITTEDIQSFVRITGDDNRIHVSESFASKTSFRKPVAHGMLSASFISTIIGTRIPGDGALWYEQHLEFLLPVRVGDEITVQAEVIKKIERLNAIELKTEIFNQHKQKVISGTAKVKIIEEEQSAVHNEEMDAEIPNALIVGSTGGIGSAIARQLAKRGYNLLLHYHHNAEKASALKGEIEKEFQVRVITFQANIDKPQEISDMFNYGNSRLGTINRLVHAATGPVPNVDLEMLEWEDFQKHIDIHVKAFFYLVKAFAGQVSGYGKIVGITSQTTDYPFSNLLPYTTAKAAFEGLARSLALDLSKYGIRINMVSPGITETDLNADLPEKARLLTAAKTPLKRLALPDDVANAVAYLLSSESDYLTGETIRVNGGNIMK